MNGSFESFFEAVWGYTPYPWQIELARRVRTEGWPSVVDIPTGAGKTAVLDIALHHLAIDGGATAPRRMILIVDRRVIVDQVGERAKTIRDALMAASDGEDRGQEVLRDIRERLHALVNGDERLGDDAPILHTDTLRGAAPRENVWADWPHVPVLAASTVDQVGSRLFFRGYGVSDSMKPVHAGLLGCDTLLFLDEVHLSRPFADVLDQLELRREQAGESAFPRRFRVVRLSATPGELANRESVIRLSPADRENETLERVLRAAKPATLEVVTVKTRSGEAVKREALAEVAAARAREMVSEGRKAVAVVVNRVDTARRIWGHLQQDSFDAILLTGRMRPLDQEHVIEEARERIDADRDTRWDADPLVVVATQCIEVGANYDFDGLITEVASLDAMRQRFGRMDRKGEYDRRAVAGTRTTRAVILARSDQIGSVEDPVYGGALARTWEWLAAVAENGVVDFGISAIGPLVEALGPEIQDLLAPSREAPILLPAYLDQWVQTNPRPYADPDVSLFLHGIPEDGRAAVPDVQVVWRADLEAVDLERQFKAGSDDVALFQHLAMVPPGALEAISLPVWTVRSWLNDNADEPIDDVADVDGNRSAIEETPEAGRYVVHWRGNGQSEVIRASEIPPGAMIVIPASYGGIGKHETFDPATASSVRSEASRVVDLGDLVQLRQRASLTLRLDGRVLAPILGDRFQKWKLHPDVEDADVRHVLSQALADLVVRSRMEPLEPDDVTNTNRHRFRLLIDALDRRQKQVRFARSPLPDRRGADADDGGGTSTPRWLAIGGRIARADAAVSTGTVRRIAFDPVDDDTESFTGDREPAPLQRHTRCVGDLASHYAERLGLPGGIVRALRWAGYLHDAGKADPRFQLWLYGGDEIAVLHGPLIAKSETPYQNVGVVMAARRLAGYPSGQRHELVSARMVENSVVLRARIEEDGADWDLVLHLIATHHGWCHALAPVVALQPECADDVRFTVEGIELRGSTAHGFDRLDSGITDRFWKLVRRYGRHELAYLEAILRLADHRVSAMETEK